MTRFNIDIDGSRRVALIGAIALFVLTAGAFAGTAVAAAQDDPSPPPAAYYGDITIDGEPAPNGTTIEAEIDGEVRGSITTEQDGQYGGPNSDDRKLTVNGTDSDEGATVEFYVVVDGNRTQANQTVNWSSADHKEVDLTVQTPSNDGSDGSTDDGSTDDGSTDDGSTDDGSTDDGSTDDGSADDGSTDDGSSDTNSGGSSGGGGGGGGAAPQPSADMNVTAVSLSATEIKQGETVDVTVTVTNEGSADGSYDIVVRANTLKAASKTVDVAEGETKEVSVPVTFAHAGERKITVDGVAGGKVVISELEPENLPTEATTADAQPVADMDEATKGCNVRFDENLTIDAITFGNATNGTATVADLEALPEGVPEPPGALIRAMDIQVPADLEDKSATIRLTVDASAVEDPDAVRLGRFHDGEWQTLEATSVEESGGELTYEFETPGFSTFALFAQDTEAQQTTPTATATGQPTDDTPTETDDDDTEEAGFGTFGTVAIVVIALIAVLLAAAGARLYQQNKL